MKFSDLRKSYSIGNLDDETSGDDPIYLFTRWLNEAINAKVDEPTAMVLSTVDKNGWPASRVVLLKGIKDGKAVFFTNYNSKKGLQIEENNHVALLFFWPALERQVRITGSATKISEGDSDEYFESRPIESRVGAIISPQSQVIESRKNLEEKFAEVMEKSSVLPVKRPQHWGGFEVVIHEAEFWQGRPGRLHDRIRFRQENGEWIKERLAP